MSLIYTPLKNYTNYEYAYDKDNKKHLIRHVETKVLCDVFINEDGYAMINFGTFVDFLHIIVCETLYKLEDIQSCQAKRKFQYVKELPNEDKQLIIRYISGRILQNVYTYDPTDDKIYMKMPWNKTSNKYKIILPNINGTHQIISLKDENNKHFTLSYRTFLKEMKNKINQDLLIDYKNNEEEINETE